MNRFKPDEISRLVQIILLMSKVPLLVGIDGPGGSGKSTLAKQIAEKLDCSVTVVAGDDFYSNISVTKKAEMTPAEGVDHYFDWKRLRDEVVVPAFEAASVLRYRKYDWDQEALGEWVDVAMSSVVIVEGVYTLRPELRDLFDVKICVETSRAVRLQRQNDRAENSKKWIERWMAAEDIYFDTHNPKKISEIVVVAGS